MTPQQKLYIRLIKRPIGFLGALVGIIILSPIMLGTMALLLIANKNGLKGVFFTQNRPGKNEKIFKLIKFKSMTDERDAAGKLLPDADRLTKVGKFIRKTSIDELPQLINVLKGDMAFIGPRPLLVRYLPYYDGRERLRHSVRPGITGWAQVNGRNHTLWENRFEYDIYYVDHLSMWLDIRVVLNTVKNVLRKKDVEIAPKLMFFDEYRRQQASGRVFEKYEDAIVDY